MKRLHRYFILTILFSGLFAQVNEASQAKPTAAVLDFEGKGITTQEAQVLTLKDWVQNWYRPRHLLWLKEIK